MTIETPQTARQLNPLWDCPDVSAAVTTLVSALQRHQATITGIRPADPGRAVVLKEALDRLESVRGRPGSTPTWVQDLGVGLWFSWQTVR